MLAKNKNFPVGKKKKNFPVGLVAQVCNPITQNQEGGLQVLGQPELRVLKPCIIKASKGLERWFSSQPLLLF